jgi:4-hydroxyphenylpyruvate dioxygenase-like putative hemolysin
MDTIATKTSVDLKFTQIAWVVKDITVAETFFKSTMGISSFSDKQTIRARDFKATYYGTPAEAESLVSIGYSGGTFIELIQPISGRSVFNDYLEKNPAGGIQHIAFSVPIAEFDKVVSELGDKGYPVVAYYDTPIAKIVFFDTNEEIGIMTELMGITKEGEEQVEKMKGGMK